MSLSEALSKYQTVECEPCTQCLATLFYDKGRFYTCTTCGHDRALYEIEEDFEGRTGYTGANILSDTPDGLERGIQAYFGRYPTPGYQTETGQLTRVGDKYCMRMKRFVNCE